MKRFCLAIVALFALAWSVEACNNVRVRSCNNVAVQQVQAATVLVPAVQTFAVQTAFVPVTTFVQQQAVVQQQVIQSAIAVQPLVVSAQVVAPSVNVNVQARGRLFGGRTVVRQRSVVRQR